MDVTRYTVEQNFSELIEEGSEWYRASAFDALLAQRDALQGKLACAADAIRYARINFGNANIHAKIWHRLDEALVQIGDISEP